MKKYFSYHFYVRMTAILTLVSVAATHMSRDGFRNPCESVFIAFLAVDASLMFYPRSYESARSSLAVSAGFLAAVECATAAGMSPDCIVLLCAAAPAVYLGWSANRKFSYIRSLLNRNAASVSLEDFSKLFYCIVFELLATVHSSGMPSSGCISAGCLAVLAVLLYARALTGRSFFIGSAKENVLRDLLRGGPNSRNNCGMDMKMKNLYDKVLAYMDKYKPYLKDDCSLSMLATAVYTNKSYLSRTINVYSGDNFRSFINMYRIRHAVSLIDADPHLRMIDVAAASGFSSPVSFTLAFKYHMHSTPSDYAQVRQASSI